MCQWQQEALLSLQIQSVCVCEHAIEVGFGLELYKNIDLTAMQKQHSSMVIHPETRGSKFGMMKIILYNFIVILKSNYHISSQNTARDQGPRGPWDQYAIHGVGGVVPWWLNENFQGSEISSQSGPDISPDILYQPLDPL